MDKLLIPFSIILAGIIIAGAVLVSGSNYSWPAMMGLSPVKKSDSTPTTQPVVQTPPAPKVLNIEIGTNPVQGTESAKVTVVEFGDYQCPYCGQFHADILPQLRKDFIDKGLVKFAYRDFIVIDSFIPSGHESKDAALAARCANDQGKFWPYHDKLYGSQKGENQGAFALTNLKAFAGQLKLNGSKFGQCLSGRVFESDIQADQQAARSYNISSTPTIFINGKLYDNRYGYDNFFTQIQADLK